MENKEIPELEQQEITPEEIPVLPEETPQIPAKETGFIDYFADILPELPVTEAASPAEDVSPEESPAPAETVTADTALLSEIQSAVASIISQEQEVPVSDMEIAAQEDMVSEIQSAVENIISEEETPAEDIPAAETEPADAAVEELLPEVPETDPVRDAFGDSEGFDEMFNAKAPEQPAPTFDRPVRKGRPKRRKGEFLCILRFGF